MALVTYMDWAKYLKELVKKSEAALTAKDTVQISKCKKQLSAFQKQSPVKCEFLDEIAEQTKMALITSSISGDISTLNVIHTKIDRELKKVKEVADEVKKSRSQILLEDLRETLGTIEDKVMELKNLEAELDGDQKDFLNKLKKIVDGLNQ
ncbi:MAG: hypothetical protein MI863_02765 [Desulfobacterales bacterium]|nr:hypothetical protein [Desulfobacterales bacterium]